MKENCASHVHQRPVKEFSTAIRLWRIGHRYLVNDINALDPTLNFGPDVFSSPSELFHFTVIQAMQVSVLTLQLKRVSISFIISITAASVSL